MMEETITPDLAEHLYAAFVFAIATFFAFWIAIRNGFFTIPLKAPLTLPWKECSLVFLVFLFLQFFVIPLAVSVVFLKDDNFLKSASQELMGWMNIGAVTLLASTMLLLWSYKPRIFNSFFMSENPLRDIRMGMVTWLIAYPSVMCFSQLVLIFLSDIYGYTLIDQQAVRQVKLALQYPLMFALTFFLVIFVVPCIEEILFRGFLYSALRNSMTRWNTILLTSLIFALFHFSFSQGINNFNILPSLFLLSLFLGFLREKYGNIIASIALHGTFNAISLLMIMFYIE